jgi:hypothetical protein
MELVAFLQARLSEDEQAARAATPGPWTVDAKEYPETIYAPGNVDVVAGGRWGGEASVFNSTEDAVHIARHDPARVLREIAAKRRLLALYVEHERMDRETFEAEGEHARSLVSLRAAYFDAVRFHAAVYCDHPDYDESWRP